MNSRFQILLDSIPIYASSRIDNAKSLFTEMQHLGLTSDGYIALIKQNNHVGMPGIKDKVMDNLASLSTCLKRLGVKGKKPRVSYFSALIDCISRHPMYSIDQIISEVDYLESQRMAEVKNGQQAEALLLKKIHYSRKKATLFLMLKQELHLRGPDTPEDFKILKRKLAEVSELSHFKCDSQMISEALLEAFINESLSPETVILEEALARENNSLQSNFDVAMTELQDQINFICYNPSSSNEEGKILASISNEISNELSPLRSNKSLCAIATRLLQLTTIGIENCGLTSEQEDEYIEIVRAIQCDNLWALTMAFFSLLGLITTATMALIVFGMIPATYFSWIVVSPVALKMPMMIAACISAAMAVCATVAVCHSALFLKQVGMFADALCEKSSLMVEHPEFELSKEVNYIPQSTL